MILISIFEMNECWLLCRIEKAKEIGKGISEIYYFYTYDVITQYFFKKTIKELIVLIHSVVLVDSVYFILVCQMLFGDNFLILCYFQLKLTWYASKFFFCSQKRSSSWIRQKTKDFPIDPDCKICPLWHCHGILSHTMVLVDYCSFHTSLSNAFWR